MQDRSANTAGSSGECPLRAEAVVLFVIPMDNEEARFMFPELIALSTDFIDYTGCVFIS